MMRKTQWLKQKWLVGRHNGAYNGAEVFELVGTYMLSILSKKHSMKDFRITRDNGIGLGKNKSKLEIEKTKKNIQK